MLRSRIIACLLVHKGGLYKTRKFGSPQYVGDPINAVKIFNEKEIDELIVIDIDASTSKHSPDMTLIKMLAQECRMPLCYGGGIKTAIQARNIISLGVEKIAISSLLYENPQEVTNIAKAIGKQSVVGVFDIRKINNLFRKDYEISYHNNSKKIDENYLKVIESWNNLLGEIVINRVDLDGEMCGYDLELAKKIRNSVTVPLTFLGGCGSVDHIKELINEVPLIGAAAGSLFVFKGKFRAVLINYFDLNQRLSL